MNKKAVPQLATRGCPENVSDWNDVEKNLSCGDQRFIYHNGGKKAPIIAFFG